MSLPVPPDPDWGDGVEEDVHEPDADAEDAAESVEGVDVFAGPDDDEPRIQPGFAGGDVDEGSYGEWPWGGRV
jgi:hypothetical protein